MNEISPETRTVLADLIVRGEPLPLDFKTTLFPPDRDEYELVYSNKEREEDILADTMGEPFQAVREFGKAADGTWRNHLIFGDNLQAMKTLLQMKRDGAFVTSEGQPGIKLIYIDPPFATRREFAGVREERAYQDKVVGAAFVEFLRKRLIFIRELLSNDGCLYVHLDWRKAHYVKTILDEVFEEHNFVNEIIWSYRSGGASKTESLPRKHDSILFYRKSSAFRVNTQYERQYLDKPFMDSKKDAQGRFYVDTILRDVLEGDIRIVRDGDVITNFNTRPVLNLSSERLGYPTQKPEGLVQLLLEIGSAPGDPVADFFAGSGTTLAAAQKLGRRWIGIDSSKVAIYTTQRRLLGLQGETASTSQSVKTVPFTLFNAGLYDFSRLRELPWKDWRFFALRLFECEDNQHRISGVTLDGYRSGSDVLVFDHMQDGGVVLDHGFVDDLHSQIARRTGTSVFIIAPAASVVFLEDYIDKGDSRYYILRIPYSIINELHNRPFEALLQPVDESQVNSTVEAVGFDFMKQPLVECSYRLGEFEGNPTAEVQINTFRSEAMAKGASLKGNREALAMVLADLDYPFDKAQGIDSPPPFELDLTFYAASLETDAWVVRLPFNDLGTHLMLIYIDIYGNEYTEVKERADFESSSQSVAATRTARKKSGRTSPLSKAAAATKRTSEAAKPVVARNVRSRTGTVVKVSPTPSLRARRRSV